MTARSRLALASLLAGALLAALAAGGAALPLPLFGWMAPTRIERSRAHDPDRVPPPRAVVLVSIDGLASRVLARVDTPTLDRLAREGRAAREARAGVPSHTLASHASMLSGLPPERHGITWNRYQPWTPVELTTLFTVCAREKLRCGLFAGKHKLAHFAEGEPGVERYAYGGDAEEVLSAALDYLADSPDFAFVHLAEVDTAGHAEGWDSPAQRRALGAIDARLGDFLARAQEVVTRPLAVIVTSDHGGHGRTHGSGSPDDVDVPWIAWGDGVPPDAELSEVLLHDTAPTVLGLLGVPPPADWEGRNRL